MPVDPVHPDPEELAAWQAGDLSGRGGVRVEAHVAGCADCARVVATVERGRAALADLVEVELPTGLHERLATAIQREAAAIDGEATAPAGAADGDGVHERHLAAAADGMDGEGKRRSAAATARGDALDDSAPIAEPIMLDGRRHGRRSPAGRRRIAVLSAAAAVILLVVGLFPVLRHLGGQTVATQGAGSGAATASGTARESAPEALPVFPAPAGYSGTALQSALASDPAARSAYRRAASEVSGPQPRARDGQQSPVTPQFKNDSGGDAARPSGGFEATSGSQALAGSQKVACVTNAQNQAGGQGLRPAFFVNTVYRGRPATVLVMVRPGAPDQAELWAFPRDNCSAPPFAHDRVTVSPP